MPTDLAEDVERFLTALVGSRARGAARPDSDVDVVVLSTDPDKYVDGCDWIEALPGATLLDTRQWGVLTERRLVLASGTEVDFGVVHPSWASTRPLDAGTAQVARDGLVALHDPDGVLAEVIAAAS